MNEWVGKARASELLQGEKEAKHKMHSFSHNPCSRVSPRLHRSATARHPVRAGEECPVGPRISPGFAIVCGGKDCARW